MGLDDGKKYVKMLFLIFNTICLLVTGVYLVSNGVSYAVVANLRYGGVGIAIPLVTGLVLLGLAVLGYVGAICERRKLLILYSRTLGLLVVMEVVALSVMTADALKVLSVMLSTLPSRPEIAERHQSLQEATLQLMTEGLSFALMSLVAISLAVAVAIQPRRQGDPGNQGSLLSPPPAGGPPLGA